MSHPLTDKMCSEIDDSIDSEYGTPTFSECIRKGYDIGVKAGRDEQLEQCIAWLDDTDCDDPQETATRLRQAMRPAAQQEES